MKRLTLAVAMVVLACTSAQAGFRGSLNPDCPLVIRGTTVNSGGDPSALTIFYLGKTLDFDTLAPAMGESQEVSFDRVPRNTRRLIIEVDVPLGGNTRVQVSSCGSPVFPDETIAEDRRYVLEVAAP